MSSKGRISCHEYLDRHQMAMTQMFNGILGLSTFATPFGSTGLLHVFCLLLFFPLYTSDIPNGFSGAGSLSLSPIDMLGQKILCRGRVVCQL